MGDSAEAALPGPARNEKTDLQSQLNRLRIVQSLRFTVLCLVIFVVSSILGLSTGILSVVPAIILVLFLKEETLAGSLGLLIGVACGTALVFLFSRFFSQEPVLFLTFSLISIFWLSYTASQSILGRWNQVAFAVGTVFVVLSALYGEITGAENGVDVARLWLTELPVGIVLLWIIMMGLWPFPKARDIEDLVEATRRECAALLRRTANPDGTGFAAEYVPSRVSLKFLGELARTVNLNAAKFAGKDHDHAFMISRLDGLSHVYADIRYIQRAFADLPAPGLSAEAEAAAKEIIEVLADRVEGAAARDISAPLAIIKKEEQRFAAASGDNQSFLRLSARLSGFIVALDALGNAIADYENPEPKLAAAMVSKPPVHEPPHLMVDSLRSSIKIVLGVMLGLTVFMVTGLPAGSYLVLAILIVLVQPNLGKAHLRFQLWFPGVVFGSLWALLGIMALSLLPHFAIYLVWLLPGLFLAAYFGLGPDRVAYVGIQIVAAMATILGMAVFPINNVMSADERILGAAIGFLISLLVYHFIWPVHPADLLRRNLVRNMRNVAHILSRIVDVQTADRNAAALAELDREVSDLKLQIQANTGLLYDISYMITNRVKPAYNYQVLNLQVAFICVEIWCLQQVLSGMQDVEERKNTLAPIVTALAPLDQVFRDLADRVELGEAASAADIREGVGRVRDVLMPYRDTITSHEQTGALPATQYGVDAIGIMIYHLDLFADAMNDNKAASLPRTTDLEQLYEATHQ